MQVIIAYLLARFKLKWIEHLWTIRRFIILQSFF